MPTTSSIEKPIVPVQPQQLVQQLSPGELENICRCFIRLVQAPVMQPREVCNYYYRVVVRKEKSS